MTAATVGLAWLFGSAAAPAPDAPMALMLSCAGTEASIDQTGSTTTVTVQPGVDPGIGSPEHRAAVMAATRQTTTSSAPVLSTVRVPARMSVAIEGERVTVRPPEHHKPGLGQKKSPDGWYLLSDVEITDRQIRGRAGYGGLLSGKHKLAVDRLTGDVRFGDFVGVCERAETGPAERKF